MSNLSTSSWIEEEFSSAIFSEPRLLKRFKVIASELGAKPEAPINQASLTSASTKGAYRFFNNESVDDEMIVVPHIEATILRCMEYDEVVVAQDTTFFDYSSHESVKGLSPFQKKGEEFKGIALHTGLAMGGSGLPLGQIYHHQWVRETKVSETGHKRSMKPIEELESSRWLHCIAQSRELLDKKRIIHVGDREADIFEVFQFAHSCNVDLVIRSSHDRRILEGNGKLVELLNAIKSKEYVTIEIPSSGSRKKRTAKLHIKYSSVTLDSCPTGVTTQRNAGRVDTQLWVVEAKEKDPPAGVQRLEWRLLTTLAVKKLDDAIKILQYYRMRWNIELYFKTLKSGCKIEDCRLETVKGLKRYNALMSVFGWRLFWMVFIDSHYPEASCEAFFKKSEWQAAWMMANKSQIKNGLKARPPEKAPSLKEVIRWIANLGGLVGQSSKVKPGIITMWRGWMSLVPAIEMYEMMSAK